MFLGRRRILLISVVMMFIPVAFFARHEYFSNYLIKHEAFEPERANAAKHAYAAGQLYGYLRTLGVGVQTSESIILTFGEANEYVEQLIRFPKDSAMEVMKDLYNNQAGIMAAEWVRSHAEEEDFQAFIVRFAKRGGLVATAEQVPMANAEAAEHCEHKVSFARDWFAFRQPEIRSRIAAVLVK